MERIKRQQIVNIASAKTGLSQKETIEVFNAIFEAVEECIMAGYEVKLGDIGNIRIKKVKSKPERMGVINMHTGEKGMLPPVAEYNGVVFKINSRIRKALKAKTLGNIFEE